MKYDNIWNSGPPPEEGWYNASVFYRPLTLRYWGGNHWSDSLIANVGNTKKDVEEIKASKGASSDVILWRVITNEIAEEYKYDHDTLQLIGKQ